MDRRQMILKVFTRKHQLSLQSEALAFLEESLEDHGIEDDQVAPSLELIVKEYLLQDDCATIVTKTLLQRVLSNLQSRDANDPEHLLDADEINPNRHLFFIDAFEMPRWHFSQDRKTFERASTDPTIAGSPESRTLFLRDRHNIIRQVVLRNEYFSPPAFAGRDRANYLQLTSTKNLLGRSGGRFMLFGLLVRSPEGRLCLEDIDGVVELNISETLPNEGLYTEGCFALVEGEYTDEEILVVFALGHPPSERREVARSIFGHIDFLGKGATTITEDEKWVARKAEYTDVSFIILSDLWLDHPSTLPGIKHLLRTCIDKGHIPLVFIFCGNFTSKGIGQGSGVALAHYQDNFDALADTLADFPQILSESHFLFVPGPLDPWTSSTLPRPAIPASFTARLRSKIPHVHFGSNPCRIKIFHQEIVIFRENLMARMLRNLVAIKPDIQDSELNKYLVQTIVDQAHLSPVPLSVQATLWEFDHALRLYPMPTAVILADKYQRYELTYEGCHVFNPGSFIGNSFGFSVYFPSTGKSHLSELDETEM